MKHLIGFALAVLLTLAAFAGTATAPASAQALGPEGRVYAVETRDGRYNASSGAAGAMKTAAAPPASGNLTGGRCA